MLSPDAERILDFARKEAARCRSAEVGPEHILLGIVQEGRSAAADLLRELGVNLERVRQEIEWKLAPASTPPSGAPGLSVQARRVVEQAGEKARAEHLLLAILKPGSAAGGIASEVLSKLGVRYESLIEALDSGDR